ncbi:MAG: hypothetical protein M3R27_12865 [Bacteroidota bacterium]|nr:hypothetical protein [Bacteroidota bacterium]
MANTHVISFIQSLSNEEIKISKDYLIKFQPLIGNEKESKEFKLFEYILNNQNSSISDNELIKATETKDIRHLKNNLFHKILESLTLDKHLDNKSIFNDYDRISLQLKKQILSVRILYRTLNQKKTESLIHLIDDIITEAKEFEIYDIISEALIIKKYIIGSRVGVATYEKINEDISFFSSCHTSILRAVDNYFRLILNNDFINSLSKKQLDKHIQDSIEELKSDYKRIGSQQINYYLLIMQSAYAESQKDFKKATEFWKQIIVILKKNKVVYRKERMGFAFTNLSQFKTKSGDFEAAIKDARNAQNFYIENSFNFIIAKEQEFHACFYGMEYEKAMSCIRLLLDHSLLDTGEFRKSKYIYYQACVFFRQDKFKDALQLLNTSLELEKDKTRGNLIIRIFHIMIFIELDKLNEASSSIESLRKYLDRTGKGEDIQPRHILISKVLRELEKSGFEYKSDNLTIQKQLKELADKKGPAAWEYYTSGLIPFHEWLEKKKKK